MDRKKYPKWGEGSNCVIMAVEQEIGCIEPNIRITYNILDGEFEGQITRGWFKKVNGRNYATAAEHFFECFDRPDLADIIKKRDMTEAEWKQVAGQRGKVKFVMNSNTGYIDTDWFFARSEEEELCNSGPFDSLAEARFWCRRQEGLKEFKITAHPRITNIETDFCIEKYGNRLCIEIDGSQHEREGDRIADLVRDKALTGHGWPVLRIPASLVMKNIGWIYQYVTAYFDDFYSAFERKPKAQIYTGVTPKEVEW